MNVLFDLLPALAGYAGIPQETRLLFSALQGLEGMHVDGLIQSRTRWLPPGGTPEGHMAGDQKQLAAERMSQALRGETRGTFRRVGGMGAAFAVTVLRSLAGRVQPLDRFDSAGFEEVIWQCLFEKTLEAEQRAAVLRARYRVQRLPRVAAHLMALLPGLRSRRRLPLLDTEGYDVMIVETPYPGRVRSGTRLIVRYHDAIPLTMPETVRRPSHDGAMHLDALRQNAADGAWFACVSEVTRQDLLRHMPAVAARSVVIPNFISPQYRLSGSSPEAVIAVLRAHENAAVCRAAANRFGAQVPAGLPAASGTPRYLLMVSTLEPRKNHLGLLRAWQALRQGGHGDLKLVLVGSLGWRHEPVLAELLPWVASGDAYLLTGVPPEQLRTLYRHAAVTVCPSTSEGFGYSGVEALRCGGRVVASDLAVHREVYGDAAEYFEPNSDAAMAAALRLSLCASPSRDAESAAHNRSAAAALYDDRRLLRAWETLLLRVVQAPP